MPDLLLSHPPGFDPRTQAQVGLLVACLDDQSRRLGETVAGLAVEHLEWQERPGRNTIGMLLAHLAATEVGWFQVGCAGLGYEERRRVIGEHLGIDDDGLPLAPDGVHPEHLTGWDLERYRGVLEKARATTHELLAAWDDASLDRTFEGGAMTFSHRWVVYHILEHYAAHFGQILSLLHAMRDHGVEGLPEHRGRL